MRRHWRWLGWIMLWLIPLPLMPDVSMLYWLCLLALCGWVVQAEMILEPRWSIDDELAEVQSWT